MPSIWKETLQKNQVNINYLNNINNSLIKIKVNNNFIHGLCNLICKS